MLNQSSFPIWDLYTLHSFPSQQNRESLRLQFAKPIRAVRANEIWRNHQCRWDCLL